MAHHAIFNICEPIFESLAIPDTYACFKGRGQLRAVARAQHFSRKHRWALKLDVRKFFDSVSHSILMSVLMRQIKDEELLLMFYDILATHASEPTETSHGRGLPIGALTSQHLANYYLAGLDRFVTSQLGLPYVRYMDDMVVWSKDRQRLQAAEAAIHEWLSVNRALDLNACQVSLSRHGIDFLGYRVHPNRVRLSRRNERHAAWRYWRLVSEFEDCRLSELEFQDRLICLVAWLQTADTMNFRGRLFGVSK